MKTVVRRVIGFSVSQCRPATTWTSYKLQLYKENGGWNPKWDKIKSKHIKCEKERDLFSQNQLRMAISTTSQRSGKTQNGIK